MHHKQLLYGNKPAIVDSNFIPDCATWRTWRNITSSLILVHSFHYVRARRHPQSRKYITYCTVVKEGTSHGHW